MAQTFDVVVIGGGPGGYVAAMWLDPLKAERTDHLLLALSCLAMTVVALVASLAPWLARLL